MRYGRYANARLDAQLSARLDPLENPELRLSSASTGSDACSLNRGETTLLLLLFSGLLLCAICSSALAATLWRRQRRQRQHDRFARLTCAESTTVNPSVTAAEVELLLPAC